MNFRVVLRCCFLLAALAVAAQAAAIGAAHIPAQPLTKAGNNWTSAVPFEGTDGWREPGSSRAGLPLHARVLGMAPRDLTLGSALRVRGLVRPAVPMDLRLLAVRANGRRAPPRMHA